MHVTQAGGKKKKQLFNEINITPLTDIFLVLLIIMMVVAPLAAQPRRDITPPQILGGNPLERAKITVEVTRDGAYYVDGEGITAENLSAYLRGKTGGGERKSLVVQADKLTRSHAVMRVFEAAQGAGFAEVMVAGQALSEAREQALKDAEPKLGAPASLPAYQKEGDANE